jgi:hypothetical protein
MHFQPQKIILKCCNGNLVLRFHISFFSIITAVHNFIPVCDDVVAYSFSSLFQVEETLSSGASDIAASIHITTEEPEVVQMNLNCCTVDKNW